MDTWGYREVYQKNY